MSILEYWVLCVLFCLKNPSGAADMAIDLRSCGIDFHTVPAHVCPTPEIQTTLPFEVVGYTINSPESSYLTWCNGHADILPPSQWEPITKLCGIIKLPKVHMWYRYNLNDYDLSLINEMITRWTAPGSLCKAFYPLASQPAKPVPIMSAN